MCIAMLYTTYLQLHLIVFSLCGPDLKHRLDNIFCLPIFLSLYIGRILLWAVFTVKLLSAVVYSVKQHCLAAEEFWHMGTLMGVKICFNQSSPLKKSVFFGEKFCRNLMSSSIINLWSLSVITYLVITKKVTLYMYVAWETMTHLKAFIV